MLISFMGVGEPLLNIDLIIDIFMNERKIKELGYRHISYALSTMMPNKNLRLLYDEVNKHNIPLKVHFLLHTPIDDERKELIPSTNIDIDEALKLLIGYKNLIQQNNKIMNNYKLFHRNNIPIEIHYTLIKGVDDGKTELNNLIELLNKYNIPIKFIRFNPIKELERSDNESMWNEKLKENVPNLIVKSYSPPGRDVGSSCGEFTKHYYHYKTESKEEFQI